MLAAKITDEELVARVRAGEVDSYDALYLRHREAVARTLFLVVGNADTAQDLAQEAFGLGLRDLARLRAAERFRSWVTGIGMNLARRRWRSREEPNNMVARTEASETDERLAIIVALRKLPMAQRAVLVLRFYGDLDEAEIAATLGIPIGTVKSRMARGRARLAAALEVSDG